MIRALTLGCVAFAAFAGAAAAQSTLEPIRPVLRSQALVTGDVVRIGDLVDHAGVIARVPIFRAPDLGSTGTVSADAVIEAVRNHALVGLDPRGVHEVTVTRASRTIPASVIETVITEALAAQHNLGDPKNIAITFERELRAIHVEPSARGEPRVSRVTLDSRSGRFEATLEMPTGAADRGLLRLFGRAVATAEVVTLLHAVERGGIVKMSDLAIERRPRAEIGRDAVSDPERVLGLAARNALPAGRPLRSTDLTKPELVQRGETVTMLYQVPGVTLTVRGKATEAGAEGDVISVLNEQSKRTVQGTVVGPGRVVINTSSPRIAANLAPSRAADRNVTR